MGYGDFCQLTPGEFAAVYAAHARHADDLRRDAWERMRIGACLALQPYMKKQQSPEKVLPLPWDKKASTAARQQLTDARKETKEEHLRRFEQLVERTKRPTTKE